MRLREVIAEVKLLSKVKGKGAEPGRLPKAGGVIRPDQAEHYLGQHIADISPGREVWRDVYQGQVSYHIFDRESQRATMTVFGSRYRGNPSSLVIDGVYAAPSNAVRASDFYRWLVRDQGLTLVSDRKQSPGGQRVWQQLEQFPDVEVYGYDTRTGETLNIGASDEEMYSVPASAARGRDMAKVARDIRLVATAR